jgi:putative spermidine/putrescine transport system ATP-binding protein
MRVDGEVESLLYLGANTRYDIRLPGGGHLAVVQQNRDAHYAPGQGNRVTIWWHRRHLMTFGK